jgi:hypothetical protein
MRIYFCGVNDGDAGRGRRGDGGQALAVQPPGIDPARCAGCQSPVVGHDPDVCPWLPAYRPAGAGDLVQGDLVDVWPGDELGEELPRGHLGSQGDARLIGAEHDRAAGKKDHVRHGENPPIAIKTTCADENRSDPKMPAARKKSPRGGARASQPASLNRIS